MRVGRIVHVKLSVLRDACQHDEMPSVCKDTPGTGHDDGNAGTEQGRDPVERDILAAESVQFGNGGEDRPVLSDAFAVETPARSSD